MGREHKHRGYVSATHLTCREVTEIISDYLDGDLSPERRDEFERHLVNCAGCSAYLRQMRITVQVSGSLREQDVPQPMMDALLTAYRAGS